MDDILRALINSGVVIASGHEPEEPICLRYSSLMRQWPQLNKLIGERISYRNMALNWEQTGKRSGRLLDWSTTRKFKSFGNLNETERTFIGASEVYKAKVYAWGSASLVVLVVVLVASISLFLNWKKLPLYAYLYGQGIAERVTWGPTRTAADIRWLADNPKWLFDSNKTFAVQSGSIEDVDLSGLSSATVPRFSELSIKNVIFDRANLPGVTFKRTKIADVMFREAILNFATFTESTVLTRTSFNQANLTKATFDGVRFCAGVDFSDANVTDASFDVIFFNNNVPPNMKNTAWWLATNWNEDQSKLLAEKYPKTEIEGSLQFKKELRDIQVNLDSIENYLKDVQLNSVDRETLLVVQAIYTNSKAWAFAKYGVIRPKEDPKLDSEKLARESIRIVDELINKPDRDPTTLQTYRKLKAMVNDTLAYIIIQREGSPSQRLDEAIDRLESAKEGWNDSEVYFKLAIALNIAKKDDPKAAAYLEKSVQEKRYVPTHELYLLAPFITQPFWEIIAKSKTAKATPSKNAAVDDPGVQQKNSDPCEAGQSSQNSK